MRYSREYREYIKEFKETWINMGLRPCNIPDNSDILADFPREPFEVVLGWVREDNEFFINGSDELSMYDCGVIISEFEAEVTRLQQLEY